MTDNSSNQSIPKFRPASKEDFAKYANNLSWLIQEPLQKTQELLSRIYGYTDLHDLQCALAKPGKPGPYDFDWVADIADGTGHITSMPDIAGRNNRILAVIAKCKRVPVSTLRQRYFLARDIGLFLPPKEHRKEFQAIRKSEEVLLGQEHEGVEYPSVFDYAHIELDNGKAVAVFTPLGKAVYDAVERVIPDESANDDQLEKSSKEILRIASRHPNNPWIPAMYVNHYSERFWQGEWDGGWNGQRPYDANPGYARNSVKYAKMLLPHATSSIRLFRSLYGKHTKIPGKYDSLGHYDHGGDARWWPSILYTGGVVAMNAGELDLAYRWLSKHAVLEERGYRYSDDYMATLRLLRGKGAVSNLFRLAGYNRNPHFWGYMAAAADAYVRGDHKGAAAFFADAISCSSSAAEPFVGRDNSIAATPLNGQKNTAAKVQEFMFRTAAFWKQHPDATKFFQHIASAPKMREAVRTYWSEKSQIWGSFSREGLNASTARDIKVRELANGLREIAISAIPDGGQS